MNRDYWRHAGNAKWGMEILAKDIQDSLKPKPKPPMQQPRPIEHQKETSPNSNSSPTYNYYNYNYPSNQRTYRTLGFWRTIVLVVFLMFIAVLTYYIVFEPEVISLTFHRVVDFFHSF